MREGGSHGRIIGYETEPEWDELERSWMLALEKYEATLCPLCGLPIDYCHDPARERDVHAEVRRCFVTDARISALDDLNSSSTPPPRQGAQTTRLIPN
jgi:hypothetical protein